MNDQLNAISLLQNISEDDYWESNSPAEEESILKVEQELNQNFPEDYRQFLLYSDGGVLDGRNNVINLFPVQDVAFFTLDPIERLGKTLPGMIIFGNDNGDCIYYFDPINYLGKGHWSAYIAYSSRRFEYSSYIAQDFTRLIHYILRGDSVYNLSFLQKESIMHRPD